MSCSAAAAAAAASCSSASLSMLSMYCSCMAGTLSARMAASGQVLLLAPLSLPPPAPLLECGSSAAGPSAQGVMRSGTPCQLVPCRRRTAAVRAAGELKRTTKRPASSWLHHETADVCCGKPLIAAHSSPSLHCGDVCVYWMGHRLCWRPARTKGSWACSSCRVRPSPAVQVDCWAPIAPPRERFGPGRQQLGPLGS